MSNRSNWQYIGMFTCNPKIRLYKSNFMSFCIIKKIFSFKMLHV